MSAAGFASKVVGESSGSLMEKALDAGAAYTRAGGIGAGAISGAIAGGFNPMGDEGFFKGALKGAVVGGIAGGISGRAFGTKAADSAMGSIPGLSRNGNLIDMPFGGGVTRSYNMSGLTGGIAGSAAGFVAGAGIGGGGRRRNTTISSNGWSKGTHPMYFGG